MRELLAFEIASGGQVSIVNRLDRETSGLVLVAKTAAAARRYGLLMQQHRLRKEYLAIVWGWPEWEQRIVDAPLDRRGKYQPSAIWLKQMIHSAGSPAHTEFRVERRFKGSNGRARPEPAPRGQSAPVRNASELDRFSLIRARGARIRFACTLARSVIRLWATKSMARTSNFTYGSSTPGGHPKSSSGYFCRGMRFTRQNWRSKARANGIVPCLSILRNSWRDSALRRSGRRSAASLPIAIPSTPPMVGAPDENALRFCCFRASSRVLASVRWNGTIERRTSSD